MVYNMFNLSELSPSLKTKFFSDIVEFRTAFSLPIATNSVLSEKEQGLHRSLLVEKLSELGDARTKQEIADSLVDQAYVAIGSAVHKGGWTPEIEFYVDIVMNVAKVREIPFVQCWDEIHTSNMTKLAKDMDEVRQSIEHYQAKGVPVEYFPIGSDFILKCASDCVDQSGVEIKKGKVIKSIFYRPADLSFVK